MAKSESSFRSVRKFGPKELAIYIGLVLWAVINLFPVYWLFTFSLKSNDEILGDNIAGLPRTWLWSNYSTVLALGGKDSELGFFNGGIIPGFVNSAFIAVVTVGLVLIASMMATFALTRLLWKGKKRMNSFFMLGLTIPVHVAIVPLFIILGNLHLKSTYIALIVPYAAFSLAMGILVCTGFMQDIPKELDEAACIDGCGAWGIFFRVIVPLMKPAVATVAIYTLLQCWNEFMFASIFISDARHKTIPVVAQALNGAHDRDYGATGAALVLATFPVLIFYIFFSKKIQDSFIAGAVKG
ncbi:MAG: carbohydrate ABC transporter permease [Lachnospiraceae bacterium]|nr:carbohydrate ABC transporter permease [Lachnospiraceae bacterium]